MKVRLAKPQDAREIFNLRKETWLCTYPNEKYGVKVEEIKKRFENEEVGIKKTVEKIQESKNPYWVVEEDGKIIGFARVKGCNKLKAIYVLPSYQRRGVGKLLMKMVLDYCKNSKELFVETAVYNKKAMSFYEKFGFEVVPNFESKHESDGIFIPSIKMKKSS